jgi:hypothetical protein
MAVPNTDNITTTTLQLIRRRIADNVFKANPLAAWMLAKNRVKTESGGKFIAEPLMYATNSTVQAYSGYDRLNIAPTQELTEADYNWRQAAVSITISGEEELKNSGPNAIFSLLGSKLKVAELSMRQWLDEKFHAATSSKDTNKDFLGLDELIDDQLNFSTVGGIDSNAYAFWRNQIGPNGDGNSLMAGADAGSGELDDPVHIDATGAELNAVLSHMMNVCGRMQTMPDLIITAQAVFEHYENANLGKLQLTDIDMMDVGFHALRYRGARMVWNENIKTSTADLHPIYFLNSEFLGFTLHSKRNFAMSSFVSPWDQDARVAQILLAGNMTCNNRRHQGVCWVDLSP